MVQLQVPIGLSQQQTTGSLTITYVGDDGSLSDKVTLADKYVLKVINLKMCRRHILVISPTNIL